jgi:hypothetical protein
MRSERTVQDKVCRCGKLIGDQEYYIVRKIERREELGHGKRQLPKTGI